MRVCRAWNVPTAVQRWCVSHCPPRATQRCATPIPAIRQAYRLSTPSCTPRPAWPPPAPHPHTAFASASKAQRSRLPHALLPSNPSYGTSAAPPCCLFTTLQLLHAPRHDPNPLSCPFCSGPLRSGFPAEPHPTPPALPYRPPITPCRTARATRRATHRTRTHTPQPPTSTSG